MIVRSVALEHFRNYTALEAAFSPGVNVIYGENAQGKTNLLEAVAYLSTASSHRARYDRELIQMGEEAALVRAGLLSRDRDFTLEARLRRGQRRQLSSNGVRLKSAGELSGILNTVLFCPEDLSLIRAGAAERRRFLDGCISQLRPRYAAALAEYRRLYEHKTRILRDWTEKPSLLETLDEFSLAMARAGAVLIHYRAHFIRRLRDVVPPIHADFSGGREALGLWYATVSTVTDPEAPARDILPQLLEHQRTHRQAELDARQCLTGPHKDDLLVDLDGMEAKTYASQGQTRTAALSLKLGCREIFFQDTGEWPVLLLDDVLSELDHRRQAFVLNRIGGGQVFITCCEEDRLSGLEEGAVFHIQGGRLV
ncbi:DNA replication/repair protein RecF [uncultured Intestinimonas sp.]|uniref:DNA replication/repair protein RecF n=2 Tax=uncultured Intestinimonas sp. TaxID=1689265 RepID=UPI0025E33B75|nr:DNA replication/repair protein RecF [uncultured Intestinimonas sp.]